MEEKIPQVFSSGGFLAEIGILSPEFWEF